MTTAADPTLASLDLLKDKSRWRVLKGVPVFCAHRRKVKRKNKETGEEEEKEIVVTEDDLHRIVREARAAERESGVIPGLWLGHRNPAPDYPEEKQPPLVGLSACWRVGKWGPKKKTAILADQHYDLRHFDQASQCPYRSAEYYPGQEITGVALLKRDPQLDLGMTLFGRAGGPVLYTREGEPVLYEGDPTAPPEKPSVTQDDADAQGKDDAQEKGKDDDMDDAERAEFDKFSRFMKRYMAAMGPSNGMLPAPVKKEAGLDRSGEPDRLQRSQEAMQYRRLEERLAAQEAETKKLRQQREDDAVRYARNEASLIVEGLDRDGYQLGGAEKVKQLGEKMARMTAGERLDYEREIRDNWSRAPVGGDWFDTRVTTPGAARPSGSRGNEESPQAQLAEAEAVVNYMRDQGEADYDRARQAVREKKAK